jgi:hypothetical protein
LDWERDVALAGSFAGGYPRSQKLIVLPGVIPCSDVFNKPVVL